MTTTGCDFRKYHRLQKQVAADLLKEMDSDRYHELLSLQRRYFPTKEQVIEDVEAFYAEMNEIHPAKEVE